MEQNLINDDLIRQLCAVHDEALSKQKRTGESTPKVSNETEEDKGDTTKSQTTWFATLGMFFSNRHPIASILVYFLRWQEIQSNSLRLAGLVGLSHWGRPKPV